MRTPLARWSLFIVISVVATGCKSPYRADQGALIGGLTGAGVGAIVGNAVGNTGAGAAIGAGVGALSGAVVGGELDDIEARNRAEIEARLGRPVAAGSVTVEEVISMTKAGVSDGVIINHIRSHGVYGPLAANDLIVLGQQGVSNQVIQAMQRPQLEMASRPVIVERHYIRSGWGPGPHYYYGHHHCGW